MVETQFKNLLPFCISLFIISVLTFSCSKEESEKVGQKYLDSEKYSDFKQDTDREIQQNKKTDVSLEHHLQKFSDCGQINLISLPAKIDIQQLLAYEKRDSKSCEVDIDRQSLRLLGETRTESQIIRWIILEQLSAYRDQKLIASVFKDGELRSFKTVGIFKKNPSEKIISVIEVRNSGDRLRIMSEITRNIYYPIEQENVVSSRYEIKPKGSILKL